MQNKNSSDGSAVDGDPKGGVSRRQFVKLVAGSGLCVAASGCLPHVNAEWLACDAVTDDQIQLPASPRVVEVSADASVLEDGSIVEAVTAQMFAQGLLALAGVATLGEAWLQVLPDWQAGQAISLKANALNQDVPTSPQILKAISDSLQADFAVARADIFVWDRTLRELQRAGITPEYMGVDCRGTAFSATDDSGPGYEPECVCLTNRKVRMSTLLTQQSRHLINVAVLKNHFAAKFTGCLKNHYGSFANPYDFHSDIDQHIANLNTIQPIPTISRLHVIDALKGVCLGDTDKSSDCIPKRLLLSFDPVAIDTRGQEIRNDMRQQKAVESGQTIEPVASAAYLEMAAQMGLGSMSYELVEISVT